MNTIAATHSLAELPPPLRQLLAQVKTTAVQTEMIGTLNAASRLKQTFRLLLDDGRICKARYPVGDDCLLLCQHLQRELPAGTISQILAAGSGATLEEWVEGESLQALCATAGKLDPEPWKSCGRLLGQIHTVSLPEISPERASRWQRAVLWGPRKLQRNLKWLLDQRQLPEKAFTVLMATLARHALDKPAAGIAHLDFCGENLVRRFEGTLCCIDNITVKYRMLEYDLARTWYRWQLSSSHWQHFLAGYSEFRSSALIERDFPAWAMLALAAAARFRLESKLEGWQFPLSLLTAWATHLQPETWITTFDDGSISAPGAIRHA